MSGIRKEPAVRLLSRASSTHGQAVCQARARCQIRPSGNEEPRTLRALLSAETGVHSGARGCRRLSPVPIAPPRAQAKARLQPPSPQGSPWGFQSKLLRPS